MPIKRATNYKNWLDTERDNRLINEDGGTVSTVRKPINRLPNVDRFSEGMVAESAAPTSAVSDYYGAYLAAQEAIANKYYADQLTAMDKAESDTKAYYGAQMQELGRQEEAARNHYAHAIVSAKADLARQGQTHGAQAENLAQAGLTGSGMSEAVAQQYYGQYVNEKQAIRAEERGTMADIAAAKKENALAQQIALNELSAGRSALQAEQAGAMADIAASRAEYAESQKAEADAATEAAAEAATAEGITAYNALTSLMASTDADGNEKTPMTYAQAVQEMRNQGLSEEAIAGATQRYGASVKVNIGELISKGDTGALLTVTPENLADYVRNGIITQAEADAFAEQASDKAYKGIASALTATDDSGMVELLTIMGYDAETLKTYTSEQITKEFWSQIAQKNQAIPESVRKKLIADEVKAATNAPDVQTLLDRGAQYKINYGDEFYDAFIASIPVEFVSAESTVKHGTNGELRLNVGGKEVSANYTTIGSTSAPPMKKADGKTYVRVGANVVDEYEKYVVFNIGTEEQNDVLADLIMRNGIKGYQPKEKPKIPPIGGDDNVKTRGLNIGGMKRFPLHSQKSEKR